MKSREEAKSGGRGTPPRRLLVTGGAGFIGSNLVHHLLGAGDPEPEIEVERLVNLDKLTYAGNPANLEPVAGDSRHVFVEGDICDRALVSRLLAEHAVDAVVHLAAESHVDRSIDDADDFVRTNVVGTHGLLEEFRRHLGARPGGGARPVFLHVSTDEVFGSLGPDDPPFTERTPYAPNSPYSASKAASDHLARAYFHTYGLPVVTTNCSNNYGPYQFPEKLVPLMVRKAVRGERLPVYGDGSNVRDWLFVTDHCRGLVAALLRGTPGHTYVFGGRCEMPNLEVVRGIIRAARGAGAAGAGDPDALIEFVADRPGHDHRYAIDPAKAEAELGWGAREDFTSGLDKTVRWYLDHAGWCQAIEDGTYRGERLGTAG